MIRLGPGVEAQIREEGARAYPNECCGMLLGRIEDDGARVIVRLLPVKNARAPEEQARRFRMEPDELLQAERLAEEQGLEVLGFYHSHPDHPATPSGYDLKHAWPFYSYLIVAVKEGAAGELSGWELAPDRSVFLAKRLCGAAKNL